MAVQVKFDRSKTKAEAMAAAQTASGTIFFTKDENNHQIIIGGVEYGGTPHEVKESTAFNIINSMEEYNQLTQADKQLYASLMYGTKEGDFYIYEKLINDAVTGGPGAHYEYTAYVCTQAPVVTKTTIGSTDNYELTSVGTFKAFDGNYDARNVFFDSDITMAGNYTQVGNKTKGLAETVVYATKGRSVKDVFTDIFTKVQWPAACSYTKTINGPTASAASNPGVPSLNVYGKKSVEGDFELLANNSLVPVGSTVRIGENKASGRTITYATVDQSNSITPKTWTANPSTGTKVGLPTPNWGYSLNASGEPKVTADITSEWVNGANKFTYGYTRTAGAGHLTLTVGEGLGTYTSDGASSVEWGAGAAGNHSVGGGEITTTVLGSATITLAKRDQDTYTRSTTPSSLQTYPISSYFEISNLGTTDVNHKTDAILTQTITDTNPNVNMGTSTDEKSTSITIKAVYPFRHNGTEVTGITTPSDPTEAVAPADSEYASDTNWAAVTSGSPCPRNVSTLMDTHVSGTKYYYIGWCAQSGHDRYIDVPCYDSTHYLQVQCRTRNVPLKWVDDPNFVETTGAPTGYKRYKSTGSNGAQLVQIKLTRS